MGLQDGDGLFHLGLERLLVLEHVEQLGVVDQQQLGAGLNETGGETVSFPDLGAAGGGSGWVRQDRN